MAEPYKVALKIVVTKPEKEETLVAEEFFFSDLIFSGMVNISDLFFELIAKLQKLK